jgi:hypothetical protein
VRLGLYIARVRNNILVVASFEVEVQQSFVVVVVSFVVVVVASSVVVVAFAFVPFEFEVVAFVAIKIRIEI